MTLLLSLQNVSVFIHHPDFDSDPVLPNNNDNLLHSREFPPPLRIVLPASKTVNEAVSASPMRFKTMPTNHNGGLCSRQMCSSNSSTSRHD